MSCVVHSVGSAQLQRSRTAHRIIVGFLVLVVLVVLEKRIVLEQLMGNH